MGTDYSPNHFLRQIPNCLLEIYFQKQGITPTVLVETEQENGEKVAQSVRVSELDENCVAPILALIESQDNDRQAEIEKDFRDINERACKAGIECLIEESRWEGHDLDIADDLEKMGNHYERAMWVFLSHPTVFAHSGNFQRMDSITFKKAFAWKGLNPRQLDDELEDFKQKMIDHYKNEGRGKHCKVEVLKRIMPERYCYFVYLEDYGDILNEFEGDEFKRRAIKPAFEVIFVYHPESGRIETNAKGRKNQIKKLHEAFCQGILEMDKLPDKDSNMYDLEKLKTRFNFMPRDPQDNIASVKLKFIEMEIGHFSGRRISFTDNGSRSDIYNLIDDALKKENITLDIITITKAKIQITFRKMADEKKAKTVTFEIGTPDRCNLKDSPIHQIGWKYIEKWEFASDETIEVEEDDSEPEAEAEMATV
ncbi:MAG: hypothetical protein PHF37_00390 [Phycisphaerae bacterium]|nr:hypothetical protein [Phycisphaerae bacterium]